MLIEERLVKVIYKLPLQRKRGETAAHITNAGNGDEKQQAEYPLWSGTHSRVIYLFLLELVAKIEGSLFCICAKKDLKSIFLLALMGRGEKYLLNICVYWKFTWCFCSHLKVFSLSTCPLVCAAVCSQSLWCCSLQCKQHLSCDRGSYGNTLLPVPNHLQYTVIAVMLMNMLKGLSVSSVGLPRCSARMIKNVFAALLGMCHF